ncbi:MAG: CBS domain-containing protein [Candidatus Magasanikbacteria bacterium]|nr:CBS domain-containing protein [Candidatus Magasanikbacteria bacterium]
MGEGQEVRGRIGLPLGNLTSQLFSNIYLNCFDQWVKHKLKTKHYIRYADDFVFLSPDKDWLTSIVPLVQKFLQTNRVAFRLRIEYSRRVIWFMLYLSQLLKTKVRDSSDQVVGVLADIVIKPQEGQYAPLLFLGVRKRFSKQILYVPLSAVAALAASEITLRIRAANILANTPNEDSVWLVKDIFDEQIVDVEGARVVRVNDLKLGLVDEIWCVIGIDISLSGLMRRLKIGWLDVFQMFQPSFIDWRKAQRVKGALRVDSLSDDLIRLHPADLANIIEDLSTKHGARLVRSLDDTIAAKVLEELEPRLQKILVDRLGPEKTSHILEKMSTDEVADLIQMLPPKEAEEVLAKLPGRKLTSVEQLLRYKDDTAGGLMTTDLIQVKPFWTVQQALKEIEKHSDSMRSVLYAYVVDDAEVFQGAVSLRRLMFAEPNAKIDDLLIKDHPYATLRVQHSIKDVVRIMTKYDLYTAAVLDRDNKLLGMVTIDDVMRHLHPQA